MFSQVAFSAEVTVADQKVAEKLNGFYQVWNKHKTLQSFYDAEIIHNLSAESQKMFLKKYGKIMKNPMPPAVVVGNTLLVAHPKNKFPDQISMEYSNEQFLISFNDRPIVSTKDTKTLENWFLFNGFGLTPHTSFLNSNGDSGYYAALADIVFPKAQAQDLRCDSYRRCYEECDYMWQRRGERLHEDNHSMQRCIRQLMDRNGLDVGNADSARMRREEERREGLVRDGSSFGEVATLALSFAGVKKTGEKNSLTPLSEFLKQHNAVVSCTSDSTKKTSGVSIDVDQEPIRSELKKVSNTRIDYTIKSKTGFSLDVYVTESNGITIEKYQLCDAEKKCSALSGKKSDLSEWLIKFFPDPKLEAEVAKEFAVIREESSAEKSKDIEVELAKVCQSEKFSQLAKTWREDRDNCRKGGSQCSNPQLKADCLAELKSGEGENPGFKLYVLNNTVAPKTRYRMSKPYREHFDRRHGEDGLKTVLALSSEEIDKMQAERLKRKQLTKAERVLTEQISRSMMTTLAYGCCLKPECKSMLEQNNALLKEGAARAGQGAAPAEAPAKK